jgi:hypothetical protein
VPDIGPIHILVLAFPEPHFSGGILAELRKLTNADHIRLVDVIFVQKDGDGAITALEVTDLTDAEAAVYGDITGALIGIGEEVVVAAASPSEDDLWDIAEDIPAGSAAAVVMIEHRWAAGLSRAVAAAGGTLVEDEIIPVAALEEIGAEFAAAVLARA